MGELARKVPGNLERPRARALSLRAYSTFLTRSLLPQLRQTGFQALDNLLRVEMAQSERKGQEEDCHMRLDGGRHVQEIIQA